MKHAITRRVTAGNGRKVVVERAKLPARDVAPAAPEPALRSVTEVKRKLDELSSRVRRLAPPNPGDPERFHVERSEIAAELQRLAERL